MPQDMFDTQASEGRVSQLSAPAWTLCHGSDHSCCHLYGIKAAQEVGPQAQEAALLKMLVVILVYANRSIT